MAKRIKTDEEIAKLHQEFQRIRDDWIEWLHVNAVYYKTTEDAWNAYKAQRQGDYIPILEVEARLGRR